MGSGPQQSDAAQRQEQLPFWQANIAPEERTTECPDFLQSLSAKDVGIISTPEAEYHIMDWEEVRRIVQENQLGSFQRTPLSLRRYLHYVHTLKKDHGSVMAFILNHRLSWTAPVVPANAQPFADPSDIKVLWNDWPYGIDERIVHLVVWTRFELPEDAETGDLARETAGEVERWCRGVFGGRVERDKYVWFKNWKSLKSVHAVEHFHVMLFEPDLGFIDEITRGDVPSFKQV